MMKKKVSKIFFSLILSSFQFIGCKPRMDTSQMRRADEENVSEHSAQTNSAEDESSQDDNDNTSNDSTFREENEEGSTRGYNSYNSTHQVTFYDDSETSSIEA